MNTKPCPECGEHPTGKYCEYCCDEVRMEKMSYDINWPEKRVDIAARIMAAAIAAARYLNPKDAVKEADLLIEELKKSNPCKN